MSTWKYFSVWAHQIFCFGVGGLQYFQFSLKKQWDRRMQALHCKNKRGWTVLKKRHKCKRKQSLSCHLRVISTAEHRFHLIPCIKLVWLPYKDKGLLSPLILSLTWNADHPIFSFSSLHTNVHMLLKKKSNLFTFLNIFITDKLE